MSLINDDIKLRSTIIININGCVKRSDFTWHAQWASTSLIETLVLYNWYGVLNLVWLLNTSLRV